VVVKGGGESLTVWRVRTTWKHLGARVLELSLGLMQPALLALTDDWEAPINQLFCQERWRERRDGDYKVDHSSLITPLPF